MADDRLAVDEVGVVLSLAACSRFRAKQSAAVVSALVHGWEAEAHPRYRAPSAGQPTQGQARLLSTYQADVEAPRFRQ